MILTIFIWNIGDAIIFAPHSKAASACIEVIIPPAQTVANFEISAIALYKVGFSTLISKILMPPSTRAFEISIASSGSFVLMIGKSLSCLIISI